MDNLLSELEWRGLVYDATEGLADLLATERVTAYIGFDPTASSLHVGSLLQVMSLARLQRFGHSPIAIVGGGTGMIGDPSGKSQERVLQSPEQIEANLDGIGRQLSRFLDFDRAGNAARIVNNADWLATVDLLSFLRDAGKHFTVNYLLQKESVSRRLESEEGISFTEFSYQLLQAFDYVVLHDRFRPGAMREKFEAANRTTALVVQIETAAGVRNIEEIAAIEGVDCVFIGHYDLSADLGISGQFDHPELLAAIDRVIDACRRHGTSIGWTVTSVEEGLRMRDKGVDLLVYSVDAWIFRDGFRAAADAIRSGRS